MGGRPPPLFWVLINLVNIYITIKGANYDHHNTTCISGFLDLPNTIKYFMNISTISIFLLELLKGQIISKCLFGVFNFFQKINENKLT